MNREIFYTRPLRQVQRYHWKLMSEYVRRLEKGVCFTFGRTHEWKECEAGHFIHSGNTENWWLDSCIDNIHCQDTHCNHDLHGNRDAYKFRMIARYGEERVEEIMALKHKKDIPTHDDVIDAIFELKLLLKQLDDKGN